MGNRVPNNLNGPLSGVYKQRGFFYPKKTCVIKFRIQKGPVPNGWKSHIHLQQMAILEKMHDS